MAVDNNILNYHSLLPVVAFAVFTVSITISSFSLITDASSDVGFRVELIHRDSPKSPFYNPSETPFDRLNNALQRSMNRANRLYPHYSRKSTSDPNAAFSHVIPDDGSYLMNISIGTPPVEVIAIVDTGSDLTWIQCKPCIQCFKQNAPIFDPKSSSTYKEIGCDSQTCNGVGQCPNNSPSKGPCEYSIIYYDASWTRGVIATETVILGRSPSGQMISQAQTIFGCGLNNSESFSKTQTGIVGLGDSPSSIINQMDSLIDGKFSYCLVPVTQPNTSSKMFFGSEAVVSGAGVVSTPMADHHVLTLEAITIGNDVKLVFNFSVPDQQGNMLIDSGTMQTVLPSDFYYKVEAAVKKKINLKPMNDPPNFLPRLCYKTQSDVPAPTITVHFAGADVSLNSANTFLRAYDDVVCFTFVPSKDESAIFGFLTQMNFLIGYDMKKRTVSFKPTDCTQM